MQWLLQMGQYIYKINSETLLSLEVTFYTEVCHKVSP